ncbi:MAG: hypothetical protein PUP90_26880 [Nostoc sp. S4]|nr:hypothetical protein [Nostoc sp. S4]
MGGWGRNLSPSSHTFHTTSDFLIVRNPGWRCLRCLLAYALILDTCKIKLQAMASLREAITDPRRLR